MAKCGACGSFIEPKDWPKHKKQCAVMNEFAGAVDTILKVTDITTMGYGVGADDLLTYLDKAEVVKMDKNSPIKWPECFVIGEIGEPDPVGDYQLCIDVMVAWGHFYSGYTPPANFSVAMEKLAQRFGVADTCDAGALNAWVDEHKPAMLAALKARGISNG